MCYGCWEECGRPAIVNSRVREAVDLIERVYDYSGVGGNLHVVLSDWNLEDEHVEMCIRRIAGAFKDGDRYGREGTEALDVEMACAQLLKNMSEAERASALALHEQFIEA